MLRAEDDAIDQRLSALEHACRGVVGDRLRSLSVDAPDWNGTLYRRSDLAAGVDGSVREEMAAGASCEMIADGGRTVCAFDDGYVARIRVGDTSVVATMDGLKMDRGAELSAAVRGIVGE